MALAVALFVLSVLLHGYTATPGRGATARGRPARRIRTSRTRRPWPHAVPPRACEALAHPGASARR